MNLQNVFGLPVCFMNSWKQSERHPKGTDSAAFPASCCEVAGFAPYERRMMELLKLGSAASFKRCLKSRATGISIPFLAGRPVLIHQF